MEYREEYDRESLIGTEYEYLLHEDDELFDKEHKTIIIEYVNSITSTLLLRIVAHPCLVCRHIAHKRQGKD